MPWLLVLLLTGLLAKYDTFSSLTDAGVERLVGKSPTSAEIARLHRHVASLPNPCNVPLVGEIVCLGCFGPQ